MIKRLFGLFLMAYAASCGAAITATSADIDVSSATCIEPNYGIFEYRVYLGSDPAIACKTGDKNTPCTISDLNPASEYFVYYTCFTRTGVEFNPSQTAFFYTTPGPDTTQPTPPNTPGLVQANANNAFVLIGGGSDDIKLVCRNMYLDGSKIASCIVGVVYQVTDLQSGVEYSLQCSNQDAAGNESALSSALVFTTTSLVDTTAPTVPGTPALAEKTDTSARFSWAASTDDDSPPVAYRIYQDGVEIGTSVPLLFTATGLSASTSYDFTVSAYDTQQNESAQSAALTVITDSSADITAPTTPSTPTLLSRTTSSLTVGVSGSTDAGSGLDYYRVFVDAVFFGTATDQLLITGLAETTSYDITATAVDIAGNESSASTALTASTLTSGGLGALITTFSIEDDSTGAGRPVTFGLPLGEGVLATGSGLVVTDSNDVELPSQWSEMVTWRTDGSQMHGALTFLTPTVGSAVGTYKVKTGTSATGTAISKANIVSSAFDAVIQIVVGATTYSLSAEDLLDGTVTPLLDYTHFAGPMVSEYVVGGPLRINGTGTQHPQLNGFFYLRAYGNPVTSVYVTMALDNTHAWPSSNNGTPADITGDVTLTVGGVSQFTSAAFEVDSDKHYPKRYWWGTAPDLYVKFDGEYLQDTKVVPEYREITVSESTLSGFPSSVAWEGLGQVAAGSLSGGGSNTFLSPMDRWQASYLISTDRRAFNAMWAHSDVWSWLVSQNNYAWRPRDETTGYALNLESHPEAYGSGWGGTDSLDARKLDNDPINTDMAHQPPCMYSLYMVTADYYLLEECQLRAVGNWLSERPGSYTGWPRQYFNGQVRAVAWGLRSQVLASALTPNAHPLHDVLDDAVVYALDSMNDDARPLDTTDTLGLWLTAGSAEGIIYSSSQTANPNDSGGNVGVAAWQDDFLTFSTGLAYQLGWSTELDISGAWAWKAQPAIERNGDGTDYCYNNGAIYALGVRDTSASSIYTSWGTIFTKNFPSAGACPATGANTPNTAADREAADYGAQLGGALAMAAGTGLSGASAAWTRYDARNYSWGVNTYELKPEWALQPSEVSAPDTTAPSVPTGLASTAKSDVTITMAWSASTDDDSGVAGYRLYRDAALISTQSGLSFTDTGLTASTSYTYTVLAYDFAANQSALSSGVAVVTEATISDVTAPTVPTGLASTAQTVGSISMSWSASTDSGGSGLAGYKLYRDAGLIATQPGLTFVDSGLTAGTSYTYTVSAYDNAANESAQSSGVVVATATAGSNPIDLVSAGTVATLSGTLMSSVDPCPLKNCTYSGSGGQPMVMGAWGGGAYDYTNGCMIVTGGGHGDYFGNEVYRICVRGASPAWERIRDPSTDVGGTEAGGRLPDGQPRSRHTRGGVAYTHLSGGQYIIAGSSGTSPTACCGDAHTWNIDPVNGGSWSETYGDLDDRGTNYRGSMSTDWRTGIIYMVSVGAGYFQSLDTTVGSWATPYRTTNLNIQISSAIDTTRNKMLIVGGSAGGEWDLFDIATPTSVPLNLDAQLGSLNSTGPGIAYDEDHDDYVLWKGGNTLQIINPDTWAITQEVLTGVTVPAQAATGTYGRFAYDREANVFVLANATTQNVYIFRRTAP